MAIELSGKVSVLCKRMKKLEEFLRWCHPAEFTETIQRNFIESMQMLEKMEEFIQTCHPTEFAETIQRNFIESMQMLELEEQCHREDLLFDGLHNLSKLCISVKYYDEFSDGVRRVLTTVCCYTLIKSKDEHNG